MHWKSWGNGIPSYTLCLSSIEMHIMQNARMITMVMWPVAMETPAHVHAVCTPPLEGPGYEAKSSMACMSYSSHMLTRLSLKQETGMWKMEFLAQFATLSIARLFLSKNMPHRKCTHFKLFVASKKTQGSSYTSRVDSISENVIIGGSLSESHINSSSMRAVYICMAVRPSCEIYTQNGCMDISAKYSIAHSHSWAAGCMYAVLI